MPLLSPAVVDVTRTVRDADEPHPLLAELRTRSDIAGTTEGGDR